MAQENTNLEPIKMGATGLDQLSKNLDAMSAPPKEDDVVDQLAKNWKNIAAAVGFAVLIGIGFRTLQEGRERAIGTSSERFEAAQREYEVLSGDTAAKSDGSASRAFEDNIKAIRNLDARSVYASMGELYLAANELKTGNAQAALERLKPFDLQQLNQKLNSENLLVEQALLLKAKAQLSSAEVSNQEQGKVLLRNLALQSRIVAGEALLSYLRIFGNDKELVASTLTKNPGLREVLKSDLDMLGALKTE